MVVKTVAFHHFGCKVNFSEGSALSRDFRNQGFVIADFHDRADCYVINTCVVTSVAEKKCRAAIRQIHRKNPDALIAVIGCYAELKADEFRKMEGVSVVLGTYDKFRLLEQLQALGVQLPESGSGHPVTGQDDHYHCVMGNGSTDDRHGFIPAWSSDDRTRSFLKIQDGCDYFCSYCTIPFARGRSRSDTIARVLDHASEIGMAGARELVLTGVNLGDFGRHQGETLLQLIRQLDEQGAVDRIRISSIEPDLLTDPIIETIATSQHFMPHFHIPLQSGSDRILRRMRRKYSPDLYASRVKSIRQMLPEACIAADLITGFPGETEEDFHETFSFLENLEISYFHVFTYSSRENTQASGFDDPVAPDIKATRSHILHALSEKKKLQFYKDHAGCTAKVLFESSNSGGWMHGFTENYIKTGRKFDPELINHIHEVTLTGLDEKELIFKL